MFATHDRIEVYVYKVDDNPRGVNVLYEIVSRNDRLMGNSRSLAEPLNRERSREAGDHESCGSATILTR